MPEAHDVMAVTPAVINTMRLVSTTGTQLTAEV
jgi:hypothetical protein